MLKSCWFGGALRSVLTLAVLGSASGAYAQQRYTISTFAGTGSPSYSGDSSAPTDAAINSPFGITIASDGSIIFADQINHCIRKISGGVITTIVGTGSAGLSSDDTTTATEATMTFPTSVAYDSSGNLFIVDTNNNTIRKVTTDSKISRVAGIGTAGYADADDYDPDGDADSDDTINSEDSDYTAVEAPDALINYPIGIAIASDGTIYIADTKNHRIRRVDSSTTYVTTYAGTGTAGWSGDGGPAAEAKLNYPMGLALDADGNLYVCDTFNHRIRRIATDGTISTVAGRGTPGFSGDNGWATAARLFYPKGITFAPDGKLYIADTFNSRIRVIAADGIISTIAGNGRYNGNGDGGDSLSAELRFPNAVAVASDGKIYISDTQNNRIRLLTPTTVDPTQDERPIISLYGVSAPVEFGASSAFAPGAWMEIRGIRLAAAERAWQPEDFNEGIAPTVLAGTRVIVDGVDAYTAYVSPETVRVLLPGGIQPGRKEIVVETELGRSEVYRVEIVESRPALNAPARFLLAGTQYASAVLDDGQTYALPEGAVETAATRPAKPGETVTFYGIGFGAVTPDISAGELVSRQNAIVRRVEVLFGERRAEVRYAGLAQGAVGIYQLSVVMPEGVEGDAVPVTVTVDGEPAQQQLHVAAKQ